MSLLEDYTKWLIRHPFRRTKTIRRDVSVGRNESCPCGSKRKFKHCCLRKIKPPRTQLAEKLVEKEVKYWKNRYKKETGKNLGDKK